MSDSEKLLEIRRSLGWSQSEMAGAMNLDRSYLSQLESGKRSISEEIINRAEAVMYECRRLLPGANLESFRKRISDLSVESLTVALTHFIEGRKVAPPHLKLFYQFIEAQIVREMTERLDVRLRSQARSKHRNE